MVLPIQSNLTQSLHYELPEASHSAPDLSSPNSTHSNLIINPSSNPNTLHHTSNSSSNTHSYNPIHHHHHHLHHHHHHHHDQTINQIDQHHTNKTFDHNLRFERRFQALLEIINTESNYLSDLKFLKTFYLIRLDQFDQIDLDQKQKIKRNFDQLIQLTQRFHKRLSLAIVGSRFESWNYSDLINTTTTTTTTTTRTTTTTSNTSNNLNTINPQNSIIRSDQLIRDETQVDQLIERVAKAFISESPIFSVYEEFCSRHTEAADLIRSFESSPEWNSLLLQPSTTTNTNTNTNNTTTPSTTPNLTNNPSSTTTTSINHSILETSSSPPPSSSSSPLPNSLPTTTTTTTTTTRSPSPNLISNFNNQNRLTLQDFIIKPIQRIMRYPMLLSSLLKHMNPSHNPSESRARDKVYQALLAMKEVAEAVDLAKSMREVELKTELIASRMELHSSYRSAFVCLLGQIRLVGSLHILYHGPSLDSNHHTLNGTSLESFKIKYHGIFLYQTHLVIVKVKRATVYEPRHWFPIRYFDLIDLGEHSGLMPHSFSLKYRQHTFEFGARCEQEKNCWIKELSQVKEEIEQQRQIQILSDLPLGDDSIVSSVNLSAENNPGPSSGSMTRSGSPTIGLDDDQSGAFSGSSAHHHEELSMASTVNHPPKVSQRLSRNVNTLLGRTPEVAQAAIDLKLTEVFSEVLLCARLQDSGDSSRNGSGNGNSRTRTLSGTTGSSNKRLSQLTMTTRSGDRKLKRMSCMEPSMMRTMEIVPPIPSQAFTSSPESSSSEPSLRRVRTQSNATAPPSHQHRSASSSQEEGINQTRSNTLVTVRRASKERKSVIGNFWTESEDESRRQDDDADDDDDDDDDEGDQTQEEVCGESVQEDAEQSTEAGSKENEVDPEEDGDRTERAGLRTRSSSNHSHSHPIWFPGLKMVRKLSRVGANHKHKKHHFESSSSPEERSKHPVYEHDDIQSSKVMNSIQRNTHIGHHGMTRIIFKNEDDPTTNSASKSKTNLKSIEENHKPQARSDHKHEHLRWKRGLKMNYSTSSSSMNSTGSKSRFMKARASSMMTMSGSGNYYKNHQGEKENEISKVKIKIKGDEPEDRMSQRRSFEKDLNDPSQSNELTQSQDDHDDHLNQERLTKRSSPRPSQHGSTQSHSSQAGPITNKFSNGIGSVFRSMMRFNKTLSESNLSTLSSTSNRSSNK